MSYKFDNYNSIDLINKKQKKNILKSYTCSGGFIIIEKFEKMLIAKDQDNKEVAKTFDVSENGLKWIKKECRGWAGWGRLNWKVVEKFN